MATPPSGFARCSTVTGPRSSVSELGCARRRTLVPTEDRESAALAALAGRYGLPDPAHHRLAALLNLLAEDPRAPTAIRERRRVLDDHLADSLVALELDQVRAARTLVDIGSGAGLPGLPLAVALPDAQVTLLESSRRKCEFLVRAAAHCGIENIEVVHARAESWPEGIARFAVATARALAA